MRQRFVDSISVYCLTREACDARVGARFVDMFSVYCHACTILLLIEARHVLRSSQEALDRGTRSAQCCYCPQVHFERAPHGQLDRVVALGSLLLCTNISWCRLEDASHVARPCAQGGDPKPQAPPRNLPGPQSEAGGLQQMQGAVRSCVVRMRRGLAHRRWLL